MQAYTISLIKRAQRLLGIVALAMPGHYQMGLFLPLLYNFVVSAANVYFKVPGYFRNDISHLCKEISWQYGVWYKYYD